MGNSFGHHAWFEISLRANKDGNKKFECEHCRAEAFAMDANTLSVEGCAKAPSRQPLPFSFVSPLAEECPKCSSPVHLVPRKGHPCSDQWLRVRRPQQLYVCRSCTLDTV